jgi:amino acid adenylation domain-containing protein
MTMKWKRDEALESTFLTEKKEIDPIHYLSTTAYINSSRMEQSYPYIDSIPGMVEQRAHFFPNAVAAVDSQNTMTYKELNQKANLLAFELQRLGVRENSIIGIATHGVSFLTGILGILKVGAAYLPFDLSYPSHRLEFILSDSKPRFIVTDSTAVHQLPQGNWKFLSMDDLSQEKSLDNLETHKMIQPDQSAYVIYTSGSSGTPKGVDVPHRGLLNLVTWHQKNFSVTSQDRATQFASFAFDAAVWEIWPYLTAGATLYFPDESIRVQPKEFQKWILSNKITMSFVPPMIAEYLMGYTWPESTPLRFLLTGGDVLHHHPPSGLPFAVVNNYGPTECSVVATSSIVGAGQITGSRPTIGYPISNTEVIILNEEMCLVPKGQKGEIFIGGAGLAKGYINDSLLTSQKFVPHPFKSKARLYQTGDLGKLLPNGEIEFLRRKDDQIKIRGYRMEPLEIETALMGIPNIQASVVVPYESESIEKRLLAYVQFKSDGSEVLLSQIIEGLRKVLPDHMIPSLFVRIDKIPLTPNGKIDRNSLPKPDATNILQQENRSPVRALTTVEETLVEIMKKLLMVESIGVNDDFFTLGGHSLLGTQMISRIRSNFGVDLTLKTIFEASTIEMMALEIEKKIGLNKDTQPS